MPRQHQDSLLDAARQGEEGHCQRKAEVSPSVRNRDVMLWFRECVRPPRYILPSVLFSQQKSRKRQLSRL